MIVLSLFNGMNTLRQALENKGFKVDMYYSSEIKKTAIKLTQHHFSDTIQLGDIINWREWNIDWCKIDFIGSGSPCQDLSVAGKRAGIKGKDSSLFWVFIDILNHCKKHNKDVKFLQENVGSASKLDVGIMSRALGVYPVRIDSRLVVGALRDRYYWTNIRTKRVGFFNEIHSDIPQPKDRNIKFRDILTDGFTDRDKAGALLASDNKHLINDLQGQQIYLLKRKLKGKQIPNIVYIENNEVRIKTNTSKGYDVFTEDDCLNLAFPTSETRRGRVTKGKSPCLTKTNEPLYRLKDFNIRTLNKIELCRLQGFPDDFCDTITRNHAANLLGDGWTLTMIEHILSFLNN